MAANRILSVLVTISWALWFGGIIALFAFVQSLFRVSREVALDAAPVLFQTWEKYQLFLAAAALVGTFFWRLARGRWTTAIFVLLALAALAAVSGTILVTARLEELRDAGLTASPDFKRLHGISMMIYSGQALVLLITGLVIGAANFAPATTPAPEKLTPA